MKETTAKNAGERILCVLTSPKEEGQPFNVSVYAVGADKPHRVLRASSSREEVSAFLKLIGEGERASEQMAQALGSEPCKTAGV